jgi:hypothetical protein
MPAEGVPLTPAQVATLRRWVEAGATWPGGLVLKETSKADRSWWSLRPLSRAEPPAPRALPGLPAGWDANPVDRFVFAGLAAKGLAPSPPASRRVLIRRVTFDLTGLPPTPEEVDAFLSDPAGDDAAFAKVVDRLLASPHYGERWGRHWLDVVRFGESTGYERNIIIDSAWPFRDYVIHSFNADKPFDRLVAEHLAGDALAPGDPDAEIGTAFLVCGPYDNVGNQDAVQSAIIRADALDDMIRATGETFLGVTIGCARCHDHKFDPIPQADYYRLYAAFAGVYHATRVIAPAEQRMRLEAARARQDKAASDRRALEDVIVSRAEREGKADELKLDAKLPKAERRKRLLEAGAAPEERARLVGLDKAKADAAAEIAAMPKLPEWWAGTFRDNGAAAQIFKGGDPQKRGDKVLVGGLSLLADAAKGYEATSVPEPQRRLALARWLTAPDNPLTPRVLANRVWQWHFGTGIVDTPGDFGWMGGRPTHPELLDWLAGRLHAEGWRLKPIHRLIMMSGTYRQSSAHRADAAAVDGDSRLLWRFPPRRLDGESVRDTMLAVAGKLDPRMGGPGFRLYRYEQDNVATYVPLDRHGPETYRRAVYHQNARASRVDVLTDFDCPDNALPAARRASTTTPLQALTLMNHSFALDMAGFLAERLTREAGPDPAAEVRRGFLLAYGRPPTDAESAACIGTIRTHGLRAFCRAVLNSNELIHLD